MGEGGCARCREDGPAALDFSFTMAFQPIVDIRTESVFAHEALVRGPTGEGAASILERVTDENRYAFDQAARLRAIELASRLGMTERLSINFLPNAVYHPANCIRATLAAARRHAFPVDRIVFEITEGERVADHAHLLGIVREYKSQGFQVAIDDFGAGWSGLRLLADFQPHILKLDMELTRGIDADAPRRAIVAGVLMTAAALGITVIAEGIETPAEADTLRAMGVHLFQGYLFARPAFERLVGRLEIPFRYGGDP